MINQKVEQLIQINDKDKILKSMTIFLINNEEREKKSIIDLYNEWAETTKILITDDSVMEEVLNELNNLKNTDKDLLIDSLSSY